MQELKENSTAIFSEDTFKRSVFVPRTEFCGIFMLTYLLNDLDLFVRNRVWQDTVSKNHCEEM